MTQSWAELRRAADRAGLSRLRTGKAQNAFVRQLRKRATPAEAALWERLRSNQLGHRFHRQRTILQYVVDFYCPATGLVVEVDGGYHSASSGQIKYDQRRDAQLRGLGLAVLRVTNDQVLESLDYVVSEIESRNTSRGVHKPLVRRYLLANGNDKEAQ